MKYCSSCGTQVQDGLAFCPNCGSPMNQPQPQNVEMNQPQPQNVEQPQENVNYNNNQQYNQNAYAGQPNYQNNNQNMGGRPAIQNRSIGVAILLSIVTCGIYGIIWFISMVNDVNALCNDEHSNQSGGVVFLLTIVTCGIYGIVWFYQAGKRMANAGAKYGVQVSDNSTIYLILAIFGLMIVDYCLVQADLNKFSAQ